MMKEREREREDDERERERERADGRTSHARAIEHVCQISVSIRQMGVRSSKS